MIPEIGYGMVIVAALALGGYWRRLVHLERTSKKPTLRRARRRKESR